MPHPRAIWDDRDVYSFGTDEFVAMCRRVGAEPLIVVNIGTPNWNRDVPGNDFLQEVLGWIEYCNGPADSKWGQVRAANGHPEPYHVKYWEIDNETWHLGAERYADYVKLVNTTDDAVTVKLSLSGSRVRSASMHRIAPGDLTARNSLNAPNAVAPKAATVKQDGRTRTFTLPAISCGVVEVR